MISFPPSHLLLDWPYDVKSALSSPLASLATQLQENESLFQEDENNEMPVWVSQLVAYVEIGGLRPLIGLVSPGTERHGAVH
jgi:hypothetical protein